MKRDFITINLESGMPTVDHALARLRVEFTSAKTLRVKVIKLIHGYGSSGTGGRIRTAVRAELENLKRAGRIKAYVPGEKWEIFNMETIRMLDACGELRSDRDLGRFNNGITMVLL